MRQDLYREVIYEGCDAPFRARADGDSSSRWRRTQLRDTLTPPPEILATSAAVRPVPSCSRDRHPQREVDARHCNGSTARLTSQRRQDAPQPRWTNCSRPITGPASPPFGRRRGLGMRAYA